MNCRACDAHTTNQPLCMYRKLFGMRCSYHQHQLPICVWLAQARLNYITLLVLLKLDCAAHFTYILKDTHMDYGIIL